MRRITEIIIHCSATPEGKDFTVEDIRRWHLARKFADIGYHYVIYRDGSVHKGRAENIAGAHCLGHNAHSIGICYIGGVAKDGKTPKDTRTPQQKQALRQLVQQLQFVYPHATVHGHNEMTCQRAKSEAGFRISECSRHCANCKFSSKACPSFNVQKDL